MTTRGVAGDAWILALDTATSQIVVGAGRLDGETILKRSRPAGFRHGELLLDEVQSLMSDAGLRREALAGIIVGTGPGAFTGLRVGLATGKTLAHALRLPIVGVSTAEALLRAVGDQGIVDGSVEVMLLLPAGPRDRVINRHGAQPQMLPSGAPLEIGPATTLVAVDLEGRAPDDAVARGAAAQNGLCSALIKLGSARLRSGQFDDAEQLVPDYVTLPRGITASSGSIEWSTDPR
ncbi:MAG: tRNA (adenosine(37)-N6)-threonylcarbamoyltransferase complex dimerization subunit type 1 TsaB [Candidatus Limnocylindrales bacterium]